MDWEIELVAIPVTDVDRANAFYVDLVRVRVDHDDQINSSLRFVQLTPPWSACSVALGTGVTELAPGSQEGLQVAVADAEAPVRGLSANAVAPSEVGENPWVSYVRFRGPGGNTWALQQPPARG